MALCEERAVEYTKEFKVKVVELTEGLDVKVRVFLVYQRGYPPHRHLS